MEDSLMGSLLFLLNAAKVALGLGFVIFIHELGHFLLAKWNGVKVETFSIGFGPTLASYRPGAGFRIGGGTRAPVEGDPPGIGETEYVLAALPLGGYVKMLGEGVVEGVSGRNDDPRAYQNKSVWGRMGIISAGVIMNLILGVFCFAYAFGQGILEMPARAGGIIAGSASYEAGLRAGDEIVAIDGRPDVSFNQMAHRVSLSGRGQKLKLDVRRPGVAEPLRFEVEPRTGPNREVPTIGVMPSESLDLYPIKPYAAPNGVKVADKAAPPIAPGKLGEEIRVTAVGPVDGPLRPVADHDALLRQLNTLRGVPVVVETERLPLNAEPTSDQDEAKRVKAVAVKTVCPPLPVHPFLDFGIRVTAGPVVSVQANSIAAKAGIKPGDRIVAVAGDADFDPMRLPDRVRDSAGQPLALRIDRAGASAKETGATLELAVTPDDAPIWAELMDIDEPLDIPGLGCAIRVDSKVRGVRDGSPAAQAGIKVGDVISAVTITPPGEDGKPGKARTYDINGDHPSWAPIFLSLQETPFGKVELQVTGGKPVAITPEPDPTWLHPDRGLQYQRLVRKLPPQGFLASIRSGAEETWDNIVGIYGMFRGLAQRRVGTKAMGGLPRIAQIAYQSASMGITPFVQFLGMLSVNLAVLNFLPIPPLDGGQMVFLIAEKVRGRPLPEAALSFGTIAGIVFVLSLILFINFQDVYLIARDYFS